MVYWITGTLLFILVIGFLFLSTKTQNNLIDLLKNQKVDALEQKLDQKLTKIIVPKFMQENLRLNMYLIRYDKRKIEAQFDRLIQMKKNKNQTDEVLQKAFSYYLEQKNKKKCQSVLDQMDTSSTIYSEAKMMYDILLDHKSDYIDLLIKKAENAQNEAKASYYTLVAIQYENIQDEKKAEEYKKRARLLLH